MSANKFLFILVFWGLIIACEAAPYEDLKVELSLEHSASSIIKVTFISTSKKDISLPIFVFCNGNSLYMDLFEVRKGTGKDKADLGHYGGLADFVTNQMIENGEKVIIAAKNKRSCDIDLSTVYAVYQSGEFDVNYVLHKDLLDLSSDPVLTSNTITIKLSLLIIRKI